jgi:hypothetical protein
VVSVNNTPPQVTITSPLDNTLYPMNSETTYQMRATVTDQEHTGSQLSYRWETVLHHDDHQHPEPVDTSPETATTISPLGCEEENYFYRIRLTVTDGAGLSTTAQVELFPNCSAFVEDVTGLTATPQDGKVRLEWINPVNFTEVMIVAREGAPITATPSGSGSTYTANLDFQGTGTAFGGGKVVYKGRTSPQTIFNLTNNKTYYFKVFTRISNSWSGGAERAMTPFAPIVREYWANVLGTTVATIPLNNPPSSTSPLSSFEAPTNAGDNYGARVRAYVIAPQSGNYTFWIASDDDSQLQLATNDSPVTKRLIASVSGFTNPQEWGKYPSQKSDIVTLQAGQKYYVEALHKEGTNGDHLAVGWQLPNGSIERPIPGAYLAPYVPVPGANQLPTVTLTGPASGSSYTAPANITLSATATDSDGTISRVEFYRGTTKLGEDATAPYAFSWTGVAAGSYTLTAKAIDNANAVATSAAASISVKSASTSTSFYRALNLNGGALTIDNNPWQASNGAAGFSYSTNGGVFAAQTVPLVPATDANRTTMIRSSIWGSSVNLALGSVPAGSYDVWLYVWEDNQTQTYSIKLEGIVVQANYISGNAGVWKKLGPYRTTISDGIINIASSGGHTNLSGLEVWKVNPAARQGVMPGEAPPPDLISIYPNPSAGDVTVRYYAAEGKVVLQITDVLSRKVLQTHSVAKPGYNVAILPTSGLAPGIYHLNLRSASGQVTRKIVIAK